MDYQLLAADMDGTLLNENREITPRTKAAILAWIKSGRYFVPSTGRPLCAMGAVKEFLHDDMPFILYNGAVAAMHKSEKIIFSITLPPEFVQDIYSFGNKKNIPVVVWCDEKLYVNSDNEYTREYATIEKQTFTIIKNPQQLDDLARQGISKILWMDHVENMPENEKKMQDYFHGKLNVHTSHPQFLEFVNIKASKALAMEKVAASLGVPHKKTAAIGDGYNDLSMLKHAGFSIAMGNAPDEIKAVCDHVTLPNTEDGVAVWMESILAQ